MNICNGQKNQRSKVHLPHSIVLMLSLLFIMLLSGCSQYQYISVTSHLDQDSDQEFVYQNDTVSIKYEFAGENLPLMITVYNKLPQPIYFDIEKSTVVINNYQVNGPFYIDGQITSIAPLSNAKLMSIPLKDQFVEFDEKDEILKLESTETNLGKIYSFNEETTPEFYRIIIALTPYDDFSRPTFYDYSFWVSDIMESFSGPKRMNNHTPNLFYISKKTGLGKFMSWTGMIALVIVGIALGPYE